MSIRSRLAKIKQDFPQSFLTLSYLAYLDASSITVDLVNEFFSSESSGFTENALNQLLDESLITKNSQDIFIEPLVQKETVELIDKETRIIIINNIVYSLNNLITDDDIQDLRFTNEQRVLKLFKNVVKIHQNFWENTYKSEYSAELIKKLGNLNEEYFMNFDQALNNYHDVLAIYEAILPANDLSIPDLYNNIGAVYAKLGINEKALNTYNQALMLYEESLPENSSDIAMVLNNIGNIYFSLEKYEQALEKYKDGLRRRKFAKDADPNDPDTANTLNNIAAVYGKLNKNEEALKTYQEALKISKSAEYDNGSNVASILNNIGTVYDELGKREEALSTFREALEIYTERLPNNHSSIAGILNNIGTVYEHLGNKNEALKNFQEALKAYSEVLSKDHPSILNTLKSIQAIEKNL